MTRTRIARRIATLAALSLIAVPLAGTDAGAVPIESCTGGTHTSDAFCIKYGATIGPVPLNARDPFDADISFANTSDNHQTDQAKWLDTMTVHLAASATTAPGILASKALPNELVIAGDDARAPRRPSAR